MINKIIAAAIFFTATTALPAQKNQTIAQQTLYGTSPKSAVQQASIPAPAMNFIKKYFPNATIVKAKSEGMLKKKYEVKLNDGTEIDFFSDGSLQKIESYSALPAGIVPQKVANYAKSKYPNEFIKEYKIKSGTQKIEMQSGAELKFNSAGNFIGFD